MQSIVEGEGGGVAEAHAPFVNGELFLIRLARRIGLFR